MARGNSRRAASNETVRGEYAAGTGWEAGQIAPSTKYVDMDGNVTDKEPKGGGSVLVAEGDVVRPHMVAALKDGAQRTRRFDNENSPGDSSHKRRGPNAEADDAATTDATVDEG